jgi:hypothetical protein
MGQRLVGLDALNFLSREHTGLKKNLVAARLATPAFRWLPADFFGWRMIFLKKNFAVKHGSLSLHSQHKREFSSAGSEHLPYKQRVGGSNPSTPTQYSKGFQAIETLYCTVWFKHSLNLYVYPQFPLMLRSLYNAPFLK